jgi:ubiquinone/menaquinone biosynthesis C-methylase UbiE
MSPEEFKALYELEEGYWWFVGMRRIVAALLDPFLVPGPLRILDVGCGTGLMLSWWQERPGTERIFGADPSPVALQFCARRGHQLLARASVTGLPFPSESFDLVTCFEVLDWFSVEKVKGPASELSRVLKPGGLLFVRVPAFERLYSEHDRAIGTVHRYTAPELRQALVAQGLVLERLTYANALLFPLAAVWRWLHRSPRPDPQSDVRPLPKGLRWLNLPLTGLLALEAAWLRCFPWRLPFGLSLIAVARKGSGRH